MFTWASLVELWPLGEVPPTRAPSAVACAVPPPMLCMYCTVSLKTCTLASLLPRASKLEDFSDDCRRNRCSPADDSGRSWKTIAVFTLTGMMVVWAGWICWHDNAAPPTGVSEGGYVAGFWAAADATMSKKWQYPSAQMTTSRFLGEL